MKDLVSARNRYAELITQTAQLRSERLVRALREIPRDDYLGPGPWKIMRFVFPLKSMRETLRPFLTDHGVMMESATRS